ncbi:NUDIX hydrolase [Saccharopolyspora erythraea]|uniref:NUDIX hydrolase n=1 Tax=Saccharopolyspora erythraea TaxID=1836 RepID=UPI001BA45B2F|nr:NUDIX hydrolase [Saccharopolyspora erythraea]QUH04578.1 NUDIX hydrolase [Saccharopolyspora erythraea]
MGAIQNQPVFEEVEPGPAVAAVVRAAGAVLWRPGPDGGIEVAVVHRPRYDDWSLPKGKLDPGELAAHAAVREVEEETGFPCVLSRLLTRVSYPVPARDGGKDEKVVDYFAARAGKGRFTPNSEVDELRWTSTECARRLVTYPHDARVLDAFDALPPDAPTVLLVRHAKAGKRSEWTGDDVLRPLTEPGIRQRDALHSLLRLFGPERVHSAPRTRCEQTLEPLAAELDVVVESEPLLSEEGYVADPEAGLRRLLRIAARPGMTVVCSQGGVIPDLVSRLADRGGLSLGEVHSRKGSVWTLAFRSIHDGSDGTGPNLRLAAADYLDDPVT